MTDDASEEFTSRFTRRRTGIKAADRLVDEAIHSAAEELAEEAGIDEYDIEVAAELEEVEDVDSEIKPLKFIGQESTSKSMKAKMVKKFGLNKTMKFTPWKGIDMWTCESCHWTTFEKIRAKRHYCGK